MYTGGLATKCNWVTFCRTWTRTLVLCKYIYLQCPCTFHVWNGQGINTFAKHEFFKLGWAPCTHPTDRTWTRKVFYVNSHLSMFLCAHSMDWNGQTNFILRTSYMYRIHEFWDMKWTGSMHFTNKYYVLNSQIRRGERCGFFQDC